MSIGKEMLPQEARTDKKEGLYAEFHPDGQLAHFGNYADGKLRGWVIYLERGARRGRVEKFESYPFPDEWKVGEDPDEERFVEWADRWIGEITADARSPRRCSFCGKSDIEVLKLIAGPTAYICDECVKLCNNILEEG